MFSYFCFVGSIKTVSSPTSSSWLNVDSIFSLSFCWSNMWDFSAFRVVRYPFLKRSFQRSPYFSDLHFKTFTYNKCNIECFRKVQNDDSQNHSLAFQAPNLEVQLDYHKFLAELVLWIYLKVEIKSRYRNSMFYGQKGYLIHH